MGFFKNLIGGGLISGVGSAIGSVVGARQSRKNVQDQIRADRELAQYQYSQDLEMWKRANKYNEPSQQMQRLRDAGLNPNLVYGSGKVAGNAATQTPKYQSVKTDFSQRRNPLEALGVLGQFNDLRMSNAQADTAEEIAQQQALDTEMKTAKQGWMFMKTPYKIKGTEVTMKPNWSQLLNYQKDFEEQRLEHERKNIMRTEAHTQYQHLMNSWYETLKKYGIAGQLGGLILRGMGR